MAGYQPKVYRKQGGDEQVVADGGLITVESGGEIVVASGGSLTVAGVTVDESTLALTGLTATATELNKLAGVTPGTALASKAAVLGTTKQLDYLLVTQMDFGAAAGAANSLSRLVKSVTAIVDDTLTAILTVTVPNAAHAALLKIQLLASLGASGTIGAYEASAAAEGLVVITRTPGVALVATAATLEMAAAAKVVGADDITLAYELSTVTGGVTVSETFTVKVKITKGAGNSALHRCLVVAELLNAAATGITVA